MTIADDTKIIFLINGNDGKIKMRLNGIAELPENSAVWIVYTSKIPPMNESYLSDIATAYPTVVLDRFGKSKKGAILNRIVTYVNNIHSVRQEIQVVLVSGRYSAPKMMALEAKGRFVYSESIKEFDPAIVVKEEERDELPEIPSGGSMHILIDYENVGAAGLVGTDCLCKEDSVVLFFSLSAAGIERQYLDDLEKRAGYFEIVKLKNVGKNGLDFYIAVRVGQIVAKNPDTKILIVTRDVGYQAIGQYCEAYTGLTNPVIIKDSIEAGIAVLDGETDRQKRIVERRKKVSIESAYASYEEKLQIEKIVAGKFLGTEYEALTDEIIEWVNTTSSPRERYLSALHRFGRVGGAEIYRIIKEMI